MATEKRLKGIPYKCDNCIHTAACQRACIIFAYPILDYVIHSESCTAYEPKSDDVEVVMCKDCIHWYEPEGVCLKIYSDGAVSPYAWQDRNPEDFCSYGERKDNG